jgi:hypothetical protein
MIYPKLISLSSSDLAAGGLPAEVLRCVISMNATIGPNDSSGDNFSFVVATPSALAETRTFGWGRGLLIVEEFSWAGVERSVKRLLAHSARPTWREVAQCLNKELLWEFDGHQAN